MKSTKIDRTKLITVSNYAKKIGKERQTIYNWAKNGQIKIIEIDGIKFVDIS